jgi:hypothetical protein
MGNGEVQFEIRARAVASWLEQAKLANSFNDPKLLAIRNPEVAEQGCAVMAMGLPFLNMPSQTYNFAAWGTNQFGASLPYAPTLEPDENTPGAAKAFYYGTNGALLLQGGVSPLEMFATSSRWMAQRISQVPRVLRISSRETRQEVAMHGLEVGKVPRTDFLVQRICFLSRGATGRSCRRYLRLRLVRIADGFNNPEGPGRILKAPVDRPNFWLRACMRIGEYRSWLGAMILLLLGSLICLKTES